MNRARFFLPILIAAAILLAGGLIQPSARQARAQSFGPDVTTTGTAYSCGDFSGKPATNAFDDSGATLWAASQTGTAVNGAGCIGQHFAGTYDIRQITITQSGTHNERLSSVYWQYSDDGSTWHTITALALSDDGGTHTYTDLPVMGLHLYWRILAASNPYGGVGYVWGIAEIQMMEAIGNPTVTPVYTATAPSATPTYTLTPSITPTPTSTPTPDYFIVATIATIDYPVTIYPHADFGEIAIATLLAALLFLSLVAYLIWLRWGQHS